MLMPSAFYTYLNTIISILQLLPKREIKLHSLEMVTNNDSDLQSLEIYKKKPYNCFFEKINKPPLPPHIN